MSKQELREVEALIQSGPDFGALPLEQLRTQYEDAVAHITPLPPEVKVEPSEIGGVPVEIATQPTTSKGRTILYLHGGGYVVGSIQSHRGLATTLAAHAGAQSIPIDYRLAPEHPYPAALEDAFRVYATLLQQGESAAGFALAGDSAGGGLALALLAKVRDEGLPSPAAAALLSPFTDLGVSGETFNEKAVEDILVSRDMAVGMGAAYLAGADPSLPYASPFYAELHDLPPILIHVSTAETLLDDSLRVARKIAIANGQIELKIWPSLPHVWQLYSGMLEEGHQSLEELGAFLGRQFK